MSGSVQELPVLVATMSISTILAVVLFHLNGRSASRYLKQWATSFVFSAVTTLIVIVSMVSSGELPKGPLIGVCMLCTTLFMVIGSYNFVGKSLHRGWFLVAALALVSSGVLDALGASEPVSAAPAALLLGGAYGLAGVVLWRSSPRGASLGRTMSVVGLVLMALHMLNFPLVAPYEALRPWGEMLSGLLYTVIGFGFVLWHQERTAAALSVSETRYRSMFQNTTEGLFRVDSGGHLIDANPALIDLLGATRREAIEGMCLDELDIKGERLPLSGESGAVVAWPRRVWRRLDEGEVVVDVKTRLGQSAEGGEQVFDGFVRDLTREEALRERLIRSETLQAVGRLAGGLAHDFNGLLTVIRLAAGLVKDTFEQGDVRREDMDNIVETTERAASLTRQLLALRGDARERPVPFALNEALAKLSTLITGTCPPEVVFSLDLSPEVGWIKLEPSNLDRVVLNLVRNALDAMPEGGSLKISSTPCAIEGSHEEAVPGWRVSVTDTGVGMSAAILQAARKPFFSTKEAGTGLGLAVTQRVVERAGGLFELRSTPDEGTCALFELPAVPSVVDERRARSQVASEALGGVIVVVDDDEAIRVMMGRSLSRLGRPVLTAGGFEEAMGFVDKGVGVALLVTDVLMPDHSGKELAEAFRAKIPGVPILFVSGFAADVLGERGLLSDGVSFLQKPLDLGELLEAAEKTIRP